MEEFKARLHGALSNLTKWVESPSMTGELLLDDFYGLFQLKPFYAGWMALVYEVR